MGATYGLSQITKNKSFSLPVSQYEPCLLEFLDFWRIHTPCFGILLARILNTIERKSIFNWKLEQKQVFLEQQKVVNQAISLRLHSPNVEMTLTSVGHLHSCQLEPLTKVCTYYYYLMATYLVFWTRRLSDVVLWHTPFERQLLTYYWAPLQTARISTCLRLY